MSYICIYITGDVAHKTCCHAIFFLLFSLSLWYGMVWYGTHQSVTNIEDDTCYRFLISFLERHPTASRPLDKDQPDPKNATS
jgi:hypothetical protein